MAQNASAKPISNISLSIAADENVVNTYSEVTSVASSSLTNIVAYTVPADKTFYLNHVDFSGNNIADYTVVIDGADEAKKRTWFGGDLSGDFFFSADNNKGIEVAETKQIIIKVIHNRPAVGDFAARIQGVLKG